MSRPHGLSASPQGTPSSADKGILLLVEDDPDFAQLEIELLRAQRADEFEPVQKTTLADAVAYLANTPVVCVLLDLTLPDSDGMATVRSIQHAQPSVPIVVLSARNDEAMAMTALESGVQDYLVKNRINAEALVRVIRFAIRRGRAERRREQRGPMAIPGTDRRKRSEFIAPSEVAALFGVSAKTISRWADEGRIPSSHTLGGHRRFPREQIESLADHLRDGDSH